MQNNIVLKINALWQYEYHGFHGNLICNFKSEGVPTKYSYLSSNSSYNTKLGAKLIHGHISFILWFDIQII